MHNRPVQVESQTPEQESGLIGTADRPGRNSVAGTALCLRCDGLQRTTAHAVPCTRCGGTGYEPC